MIIQLSNCENDCIRLLEYLKQVDTEFTIQLSQKVKLYDYAIKLLKYGVVFCIEENNIIVAINGFYCNDIINNIAYLQILSTSQKVRGKGYAKLLINRMKEYCGELGIVKIRCDSINPFAIKLYQSLGFKTIKTDHYNGFERHLLEYTYNMNTKRYLVTAIGSFSADNVIHSLKENNGYVVGCDIYNGTWHAETNYCDTFYQAPFATKEKEYINFLIDIIKKEKIDFLIPLTDLEIDIINHNRKSFNNIDITLCIQSEQCLKISRNKSVLCELFFNDSNVNIPLTLKSEEINTQLLSTLKYPLIAKPVDGRSSEGIYKIYSEEELVPFYHRTNYIIQELLDGSVFTVDYVRDNDHNDYSIPRKELLRTKNGAGTTVHVFTDKVLQDTVSYIGKALNIVGCVNMEFILNNGKYYLIDINPRFSAGIAFSKVAGYDMVASHINCFIGNKILSPIKYKNQIITKKYVEEVTWVEQ